MFKTFTVVAVSALLVGSGYLYSINHGNSSSAGMLCHLDKPISVVSKLLSVVTFAKGQDPQQQDPPPTQPPSHEYSAGNGCSRRDPGSEPGTELDGIDPQTVGCKCAKKCTKDGKTEEDLSRGPDGRYICKNACHKERCSCPDPCKT
ncbi:MAG: hypothetical protein Q8R55_07895 [Candidatus Taylorbacteria bacterium]|nr:hypothetical protein [Candidatus Taylorbacteria bacterium]